MIVKLSSSFLTPELLALMVAVSLFSWSLILWDRPEWRRVTLTGGVVLLIVSVPMIVWAAVINDPCSEDRLRAIYGDAWEIWWWIKGCYLWG